MLAGAAALVVSACGSAPPPLVSARGYPLGDLVVSRGGRVLASFTVEVAADEAGWEKGLMGVGVLPRTQGMAFVFPSAVTRGFWMKDTLIPLDVAFADSGGTVLDVQHMVPCRADPCTVYTVSAPYAAALEVGAGVLAAAGVRPGDHMALRHNERPPAAAEPALTALPILAVHGRRT